MTRPVVFVHGVPNTPAVWKPLIKSLGLEEELTFALALPGFAAPPPQGFKPTKDGYAEWLINEVEKLHQVHGPLDIVGHDWGARLALRAASLRPELFRSWAVCGAVMHPDFPGHARARSFGTPILGNLIIMRISPAAIQTALVGAGVPEDISAEEATHWDRAKRKCILTLYRSANGLKFGADWLEPLSNLPEKGLVLWGQTDPYMDIQYVESFAKIHNVPIVVETGIGHWAIAARPQKFAEKLKAFWAKS